jgi:hypothetical protein
LEAAAALHLVEKEKRKLRSVPNHAGGTPGTAPRRKRQYGVTKKTKNSNEDLFKKKKKPVFTHNYFLSGS